MPLTLQKLQLISSKLEWVEQLGIKEPLVYVYSIILQVLRLCARILLQVRKALPSEIKIMKKPSKILCFPR